MRNAMICGFGLLVPVILAGCGKASADDVVKELLAAENDSVRFGEDLVNLRPGKMDWDQLEQIGQRITDLQAQLAALPKKDVDAAREKYQDEFLKLAERSKKLNSKTPKSKAGVSK